MHCQDGDLSLLMQCGLLVKSTEEQSNVMLCLGNRKWAALGWPLVQGTSGWVLDPAGSVQWLYTYDVASWMALKARPMIDDDVGQVVFANGTFEPICKVVLMEYVSTLLFNELAVLGAHLKVEAWM